MCAVEIHRYLLCSKIWPKYHLSIQESIFNSADGVIFLNRLIWSVICCIITITYAGSCTALNQTNLKLCKHLTCINNQLSWLPASPPSHWTTTLLVYSVLPTHVAFPFLSGVLSLWKVLFSCSALSFNSTQIASSPGNLFETANSSLILPHHPVLSVAVTCSISLSYNITWWNKFPEVTVHYFLLESKPFKAGNLVWFTIHRSTWKGSVPGRQLTLCKYLLNKYKSRGLFRM